MIGLITLLMISRNNLQHIGLSLKEVGHNGLIMSFQC
jgi:hypothetical protein